MTRTLLLLALLASPAYAEDRGPNLALTLGVTAGANGFDWHTTRQRPDAGTGREVAPFARMVGNDARFFAATAIETAAVEYARRKGKHSVAWGLLAGFAVGHVFIAGCNRTGGCW